MTKITVFTATYNRAYRIGDLYKSLCNQSYKNFEWLIVDDGSSDGTIEIVNGWINDGLLKIRYYYKDNGGKHRAINYGLEKALGELFFIVDSDDVLPVRSLETILVYYSQIAEDIRFCGVCGLKCYPNGKPTAGFFPEDVCDWYFINRKYSGDTAVVFKTEIAKRYPFPDYPGEKFCAESLMYDRIGSQYLLRYFNKNVYECEYLPDGLSASSVKNRRNSPSYATRIYLELMKMHVSIGKKVRSAINFWRFFSFVPSNKYALCKELPLWAYLTLPIGLCMSFRDTLHLIMNQK